MHDAERLRQAIGALVRQTRQADALAPRFARVLGHLDRDGALTPGDLAERQDVRQQSMSATLTELTRRGYVTRTSHPDDGRKALMQLTPAGRDALDEDRRRRTAWLQAAIDERLTAKQRAALPAAVDLLQALAGTQVA